MQEGQSDIIVGQDAVEVLKLAELEARRASADEVGIAHIALALSCHPACQDAFRAIGLEDPRFRLLVTGERGMALLPPSVEVCELLARAKELSAREGSGGATVGARHLLAAIVGGDSAVGQMILRESGLSSEELIKTFARLCARPTPPSRRQRTIAMAARIGGATVLAFAWSALWAVILYLALGWAFGIAFTDKWFLTILACIGVISVFCCAAYRAVQGRRREAGG